jgi:hypothetical protein
MPIEYWIYHGQRVVMARGYGTFIDEDIFGYQKDVWSRPEVHGYNELVDMTDVEDIPLPSNERIQELAKLSVGMDASGSPSQMAIVAPTGFTFALGHIYGIYRRIEKQSTKEVRVFQTMEEALAFLKINVPLKFRQRLRVISGKKGDK